MLTFIQLLLITLLYFPSSSKLNANNINYNKQSLKSLNLDVLDRLSMNNLENTNRDTHQVNSRNNNNDEYSKLANERLNHPQITTNYYLKWITNDYLFPIWIDKNLTLDADYKWYKYSENVFIDEIDDYSSQYVYSQTADKTILYLLTYNYTTHEQLSTYEPKIIAFRNDQTAHLSPVQQQFDYYYSNNLNNARDIFTLAYLKSHTLNITKTNNKIDVSCYVSIMLPINDEYLNEKNYQLIQNYLLLTMTSRPIAKTNQASASSHFKSKGSSSKHKPKIRLRRNAKKDRKREDYENDSESEELLGLSKRKQRVIPTSFIEFELKEGPISIYTQSFDSSHPNEEELQHLKENITCTLQLVEWDNTLIYHDTIFKVVSSNIDDYYYLDQLDTGAASGKQHNNDMSNNLSSLTSTRAYYDGLTSGGLESFLNHSFLLTCLINFLINLFITFT